jgi:hypothetical protein
MTRSLEDFERALGCEMPKIEQPAAVQLEEMVLRERYRDVLAGPLSQESPTAATTLILMDFTRDRREMVDGDL